MLIGKGGEMPRKYTEKHKLLCISGAVIAALLVLLILFYPPVPGVADQGDFYRIMRVTGLKNLEIPDWFKYITTEYKMTSMDIGRLFSIPPTTSMIYPIALARFLSRLIGNQTFNTGYLALVYSIIYISSLYICFRWIGIKRASSSLFLIGVSLLILFDGNYLVWFNSLYGEPMMTVSLLLFSAAFLYISEHPKKITPLKVILLFLAALLFLGAKMQCFPALPFILILIARASLMKKVSASNAVTFLVCTIILIVYTSGIYYQVNSSCGIDTEYNSVFYGILKDSPDPEADLKKLGLPLDMASEAGKHAYLPKSEYVKYAPWSKLTREEFNNKITNLKLLKFYLLQPDRLIKGMEYTASKAFDTGTSLGKYEKASVSEYTPRVGRFTLWSDFRLLILPKTLLFLVPFYTFVIAVSLMEYKKCRGNKPLRLKIELFWLIIIIGLMQFPMPYVGNGKADTAKQLFLFNFTFDMVIIISLTWIFEKIAGIKGEPAHP